MYTLKVKSKHEFIYLPKSMNSQNFLWSGSLSFEMDVDHHMIREIFFFRYSWKWVSGFDYVILLQLPGEVCRAVPGL